MNLRAGRKGVLVLLTCFYGLLPSCSPGVNNVLDASAQPFSGNHANGSAQHGLHAAFSAALKYLDASSNLSGRIISANIYTPQLNARSNASAGADNNSTCGASQMQQLHSSRSFGGLIGGPAAASSLSSNSKGLWQALLASMLVQQQQPATGQVSQRRYLQQLSGLREHSSRIAGLLMLDSSAWAKAPAWELLQWHAPAAVLTLQRLSDSFWGEVGGVSGAAVTVVSALVASRLLLEML